MRFSQTFVQESEDFVVLVQTWSAMSNALSLYMMQGRQTACFHSDAGNGCTEHSSGTRIWDQQMSKFLIMSKCF